MRISIALMAILLSTAAARAELNADCLAGDPTRAVSGCTLVIETQGTTKNDMASALAHRGAAFFQQNQSALALADVQRALQLNPNQTYALATRARISIVKKDYPKAAADLNAALKLSPTYHYALWLRGTLNVETNKFAAAMADFDKSIASDPSYVNSLASRGRLNRLENRLDQSLADLDRAIAISPRYVYALLQRGDTHQLRNDFARALADYDQVLAIQPNNGEARNRRQAAAAQLQATGGKVPERWKDHDGCASRSSSVCSFRLLRFWCSRPGRPPWRLPPQHPPGRG